jgi:hypothetical protein
MIRPELHTVQYISDQGPERANEIRTAVPVTMSGQPECIISILSLTESQTIGDNIISNSGLLIIGPMVVEPIVSNGIGSGQLGSVEEVLGVPLISWIAAFYAIVRPGISILKFISLWGLGYRNGPTCSSRHTASIQAVSLVMR